MNGTSLSGPEAEKMRPPRRRNISNFGPKKIKNNLMASSFVAVQRVTKFAKVSCEVPYDIWDEEVKGLSQCDVL